MDMTLGERLQALRRENGLSQETLAEKLNVSRQAVSKWETGLSNPDTENLIRLAGLFKVTVDDLIGAKPENIPAAPQRQKSRAKKCIVIAASVIIVAAIIYVGILAFSNRNKDIPSGDNGSSVTASTTGAGESVPGDYTLYWEDKDTGAVNTLELGPQAGTYPWNTDLTGSGSSFTSGDMPGVAFYNVGCSDIIISYSQIADTGKEVLTSMSTVSRKYETPRGVRVGDTEAELIYAYGDELIINPEAYGGADDFCTYDSFYAYTSEKEYYGCIVFYILDGQISGIEANLNDDGGFAYYVDNTFTFPLKNGKPDYSNRQAPEQETLSKERKVYVALHTLLDYSIPEDDALLYKEIIFSGLRNINWIEYGKLGGENKEAETIEELFNWIDSLDKLTAEEITGMLLVPQTNIDGIYADMYATLLCNAFLKYPDIFVERLGLEPGGEENSDKVVMLTAYGATVTEEKFESVTDELHTLIDCDALSDEALPWASKMLARCANPYN